MDNLFAAFEQAAKHPRARLDAYLAGGKKAVGCFPYYVPEELVHAAGMIPFGVWGMRGKTVSAAKEYFASFYCGVAQGILELGLTGKLSGLSAVIAPTLCDTLRPLSQNFRVAVPEIPLIFLAQPQNRKLDCGREFIKGQYERIRAQLEEIAGRKITQDTLHASIRVYNESRAERRRFVRLAGQHPEAVSATRRCAVLKSAYFMEKSEHTALLRELCGALEALPPSSWKGARVMTSGILADSPGLLRHFEENGLAIVADDIAYESRAFRTDVPEDMDDPMEALATQYSRQDEDPLLYDPELKKRPAHVVGLAQESGAQGVVVLMMQFCDPEELEYPSLRSALEEAGIPHIAIGYDPQMTDFGQAATMLQAFAGML